MFLSDDEWEVLIDAVTDDLWDRQFNPLQQQQKKQSQRLHRRRRLYKPQM